MFRNRRAAQSHHRRAEMTIDRRDFLKSTMVASVAAAAQTPAPLFPGLETAWGYDGIAPAPGQDPRNSSPAHIAAWEQASRGNDPSAVQDQARQRFRAKVATY